jgi:signal transduction histidine kinase
VALLATRLVGFWAVGALECSGFSRVLYVLIPFLAYFSLGRRASYALAALLVAALLVSLSVTTPSWYTDAEQVSDVLMLSTGLVMAVSMAAVAAHAQRLVGKVAELATVRERNRLARDIHDSLGHHLTVIAVQLEKASAFRARGEDAVADQAIADARLSTRHALEDVRQSVGALRDGGFALEPALRTLVNRVSDGQFAVTLSVAGDERRYPRPALMALYRAAQEGLTNASRHSGATSVMVHVSLDESAASLVVSDDGRGLTEDRTPGFGLRGMGERFAIIGGTVSVSSTPDTGTRLLVTVPRTEPA